MHFLTNSDGSFNLSAIMRAANAECWTLRTTARQVGPKTADFEFVVVRVYDRRRLAGALRAMWRQAHRQRLDWQMQQPAALARAAALDAATRLRWASEQQSIRDELAASIKLEIHQFEPVPLPLAA